MNILCIGLGNIGKAVANTLANQGHHVTAVSRSLKKDTHMSIQQQVIDIFADDFAVQLQSLNIFWDRVIVTLTPSEYSDVGYQLAYFNTAQIICKALMYIHTQAHLVFISSTGVYGENKGEECNELTVVTPSSKRSQYIYDAENYYREHFSHTTIIRASGIYGFERLGLIKRLNNSQPLPPKHWTNRIFDRDLVTVIANIALLDNNPPIYIATDTLPVLQTEVLDYLAQQLNKNKLHRVVHDSANDCFTGKRLRSIYLDPNWLAYPTWKIGYNDILKQCF